jgi:hypothetical protein
MNINIDISEKEMAEILTKWFAGIDLRLEKSYGLIR